MEKQKIKSQTIFGFVVLCLYLPAAICSSSLMGGDLKSLTLIFLLLLCLSAGIIVFYENKENPKFSKIQLVIISILFVLFSFCLIFFLAMKMVVIRFVTPQAPGIFTSLLIMSPPLIFILISHRMRRSYESQETSEESASLPQSDKEPIPQAENKPLFSRLWEDDNSRKYIYLAIVLGLIVWPIYNYTNGAQAVAKAQALESGKTFGIVSANKNQGMIASCVASRSYAAEQWANKQLSELKAKFAKKRAGTQGLSFLNQLFNQPFGDENYKNYIDKYGTNPFDALTGGALSTTPEALRKVFTAQQAAQVNEIKSQVNTYNSGSEKVCKCKFDIAFVTTKTDWIIYATTFKLVKPSSIENDSFTNLANSLGSSCES